MTAAPNASAIGMRRHIFLVNTNAFVRGMSLVIFMVGLFGEAGLISGLTLKVFDHDCGWNPARRKTLSKLSGPDRFDDS